MTIVLVNCWTGHQEILRDVNWHTRDGEFVMIKGVRAIECGEIRYTRHVSMRNYQIIVEKSVMH